MQKKIKCNDQVIEENEINEVNKTTDNISTAKMAVKKENSEEGFKQEGNSDEKINNISNSNESGKELTKPVTDINKNNTTQSVDTEQCDICGQYLNNSDIIYYQGHPQNAVEEFIALTNEKLLLASGK